MKIVSWDVRGTNNREKRPEIKSALKGWKGELVVLQETKMEEIGKEVIRDLWAGHYVEWEQLGARGMARGVLLMWDNKIFSKVDVKMGQHSISCLCRNSDKGMEWAFLGYMVQMI